MKSEEIIVIIVVHYISYYSSNASSSNIFAKEGKKKSVKILKNVSHDSIEK